MNVDTFTFAIFCSIDNFVLPIVQSLLVVIT